MLRLYRRALNAQDSDLKTIAKNHEAWALEIEKQLGSEYLSSFTLPSIDGNNVNFYTKFLGEIVQVNDRNRQTFAKEIAVNESRIKVLKDFLAHNQNYYNASLKEQAEVLLKLVNKADLLYIINGQNCVLVPALDKEPFYKDPIPPAPVEIVKKSHKGCLLALLSLLLLLLLLFLLWWFFLRPWPFADKAIAKVEPTPIVKEEPKVALDPDPKPKELQIDPALLEAQKLALEEELAKAEAEKAAAEKATAEKATAEKAAAEKAAAQKAAAEKAAKEKAKAEAAAKAKAQAEVKKIPKCKTLVEEGKMPQLAIAIDGSRSMLVNYGGKHRLKAAKEAATNLVNATDKNVSIGFIEINGCPASKNHGFYGANARTSLIQKIARIDPNQYDGQTPLVNGLNQLSKMLDGVNNEAVGILITDGEDTCPFTKDMNVCNVATNIHKRQPKLKIHAILIGDEIDSASCIAKITGGQVFKPKDAVSIQSVIKQAGRTMQKVCE